MKKIVKITGIVISTLLLTACTEDKKVVEGFACSGIEKTTFIDGPYQSTDNKVEAVDVIIDYKANTVTMGVHKSTFSGKPTQFMVRSSDTNRNDKFEGYSVHKYSVFDRTTLKIERFETGDHRYGKTSYKTESKLTGTCVKTF